MSQLDLALAADVSSRHLSFLETGRSSPSVEMVLRLAAALDVPLRQANAMLRAAGHPPRYAEPTEGLPREVSSALELMKRHQEPFPLFVMDRSYRVLDANGGARASLGAALPELDPGHLREANLALLTLDPGIGGRVIANHATVARELMWRLQREMLADPDNSSLRQLLDHLDASPGLDQDWRRPDPTTPSAATVELKLRVGAATWSFLLVVSVLQAPLEVSVEDIRIEQWFPVDAVTAAGCAELARAQPSSG